MLINMVENRILQSWSLQKNLYDAASRRGSHHFFSQHKTKKQHIGPPNNKFWFTVLTYFV